jgi:hypothetical protein
MPNFSIETYSNLQLLAHGLSTKHAEDVLEDVSHECLLNALLVPDCYDDAAEYLYLAVLARISEICDAQRRASTVAGVVLANIPDETDECVPLLLKEEIDEFESQYERARKTAQARGINARRRGLEIELVCLRERWHGSDAEQTSSKL